MAAGSGCLYRHQEILPESQNVEDLGIKFHDGVNWSLVRGSGALSMCAYTHLLQTYTFITHCMHVI